MGVDKALVHLRGRPLVEHALEILRGAGLAASIAGARSTLSAFAAVVEDVEAGKGPLGGICAALASTSAQRAVFVPVDLPLLPSSLVAYLVRHAEITGRAVTLASVAGFTDVYKRQDLGSDLVAQALLLAALRFQVRLFLLKKAAEVSFHAQ